MIYLPKKKRITDEVICWGFFFYLNEICIASKNNYLPFWPEKDGLLRQLWSFNFHASWLNVDGFEIDRILRDTIFVAQNKSNTAPPGEKLKKKNRKKL